MGNRKNINAEEIKRTVPILELATYLGIKIDPHNRAICPFHKDTNPSLKFYPENNSFYCFGCNIGGSNIDLVMKTQNKAFVEALTFIVDLYHLKDKKTQSTPFKLNQKRRIKPEQSLISEENLSIYQCFNFIHNIQSIWTFR